MPREHRSGGARRGHRPAQVLGLADRGRIQVGARADLVALDPDLHVEEVGSPASRCSAPEPRVRSVSADPRRPVRRRHRHAHRCGPGDAIDLTGVQFSAQAPEPPPLTWAPHLAIIVYRPADDPSTGVLEVVYRRDGEQIARNVQPLEVEPGKSNQRLVRGEIDFEDYGTVEAHCRIDQGPVVVVPYTMLPVGR